MNTNRMYSDMVAEFNRRVDAIPKFECPPDCTACCSPVMLIPGEGVALGAPGARCTGWKGEACDCEHLGHTGGGYEGCTRYSHRPSLCKLFGASAHPLLRCAIREQAGLTYPLTEAEGNELMDTWFMLLIIAGMNIPPGLHEAMRKHDVVRMGWKAERAEG